MKFKVGDYIQAYDSFGSWAIFQILRKGNEPLFKYIKSNAKEPNTWADDQGYWAPFESFHSAAQGWKFKKVNHRVSKLGKILYK